jgi:hypothetical protein
MFRIVAILVLSGVSPGVVCAASAQEPVVSRYTFSWPVGPGAPAPRGGTTKGPVLELDTTPSQQWQALQQPGLAAFERDRRAILAMAGSYRVAFDFLEIASFTGDGSRPRPYQSWGTEKIYVDRDDGKLSEPMVTRHWRQDWRFEPSFVVEYGGENRWARRDLSSAARRGQWSQTVYQVDESPRYGSLGRWEHNSAFSAWLSGDTARPLPRREWSVRKDYQLLRGTNRHTIVPTGWLQEEDNLKDAATGAVPTFVGREYGVARYERLKDADFSAADRYYESTREFWSQVLVQWQDIWARRRDAVLTASSDQSGAYADLFELADDFAAGKLDKAAAVEKIRAALARQGAR